MLKAEDIKELALQFKDHSVEEELSETRIVYIGTNPKNQRILYHDDRKRQPGETRLWTERTYEFHPDGRIVYNEHDNDNWTQYSPANGDVTTYNVFDCKTPDRILHGVEEKAFLSGAVKAQEVMKAAAAKIPLPVK